MDRLSAYQGRHGVLGCQELELIADYPSKHFFKVKAWNPEQANAQGFCKFLAVLGLAFLTAAVPQISQMLAGQLTPLRVATFDDTLQERLLLLGGGLSMRTCLCPPVVLFELCPRCLSFLLVDLALLLLGFLVLRTFAFLAQRGHGLFWQRCM